MHIMFEIMWKKKNTVKSLNLALSFSSFIGALLSFILLSSNFLRLMDMMTILLLWNVVQRIKDISRQGYF